MEFTGVKMSPEVEKLINEVARVELSAELTYVQLAALCLADKLNWQHAGEYLREASLRKRVQAEKWVRVLGMRGGQFRAERLELLVPVPHKEQLAQEQGKQLKIVLDLAMGVEKKVEEMLRVLYAEAKNARDQVTVEIVEAREMPKQIEMIRQLEAQLNTLYKRDVSEYMFEKMTILPLVQHIKAKAHFKITQQIIPRREYTINRFPATFPTLVRESHILFPSHGKLF